MLQITIQTKNFAKAWLAEGALASTKATVAKTTQLKRLNFAFFKLCRDYSGSLKMPNLGEFSWN